MYVGDLDTATTHFQKVRPPKASFEIYRLNKTTTLVATAELSVKHLQDCMYKSDLQVLRDDPEHSQAKQAYKRLKSYRKKIDKAIDAETKNAWSDAAEIWKSTLSDVEFEEGAQWKKVKLNLSSL